MEKVFIVGTETEVTVLHHGFDIVIVQHTDGKQQLLKPEEVGLKRRTRPHKIFRY